MVHWARNKVYHVTCFRCATCGRELATGDEIYVINDEGFVCRDDYVIYENGIHK